MSDRKLTPELQKKLMGLNPFSANATVDFTPAFYRKKSEDDEYIIPEEYQPVFSIRPYKKSELERIRKIYSNRKPENIDMDDVKDFARIVIKGWRNLYDAGTLEEIEYETEDDGTASRVVVYSFSFTLINSIITECIKISGLSAEEVEGLN